MRKRFLGYLSLFVLFCLVWWWRLQAGENKELKQGLRVKLTGRVSSEPILQGNKQRFSIGKFTVITLDYPRYQYGEKLVLVGTLKEEVINSWFRRFSLLYPDIQKIESGSNQRKDLKGYLFRVRRQVEINYSQLLPEPEASLLSGVVLGVKREMPEDFWQALRKTGTLHIVVASGYNISVIAGVVLTLLAGLLRRQLAIGLSIFVIFLYVLLIGAEPAVVRAAIMASLALIANLIGRETDGIRALVAAAGVMLLSQPTLVWDIGFQLSFTATLGLILLTPRLAFVDSFVKPASLSKDIKETTSAQIMVLPLLLKHFQAFSWLGFLVNPLVLWLVPIEMALGLIQAVFSWLMPVAKIAAMLNYVVLHLMVKLIKLTSNFPIGEIKFFQLSNSFIFLYYGIIFVWIFKNRKNQA